MKVRFYGRLGERLGSEIELDPPAGTDTVNQLRAVLADLFPDLSADLKLKSRACVADSMVTDDYRFTGSETVEFFPPLSGG